MSNITESPASLLHGPSMDDEATHITIGPRLGSPLFLPHICAHYGEDVDQYATHSLNESGAMVSTPDMER